MIDPQFKQIRTFNLTVPSDYVHNTRLATFVAAHGSEFTYLDSCITDYNLRKATVKLMPGRKFKVKIFQIKTKISQVTAMVDTDDCLEFLRSQNAVLVGAQGASLVYELIKSKLPEDLHFISFDEEDAIMSCGGTHLVPFISRESFGDFNFGLITFWGSWPSGYCLLCFCDCT